MKTQKQHRNDKLQKSSLLFLQLGLVLALFVTYTTLEFRSIKKSIVVDNMEWEPPFEIVPDVPTIIFKKEKVPVEKKTRSKIIEKIEIVPNIEPTIEQILEPTDIIDEPTIKSQIENIVEVPTTITDDPQPFILIENPPIFPGCENLEKEASKKCFANGISKFVNKKFNTEIAEGLNGKQKIYVQFVIDKTGTITDIQASSPHERLKKEAIRVVEKLPKMTPGMQRMRAVKVTYTLPIVFHAY